MLTNLRELRAIAEMTQQDVAEALGISRQAYSNYEQGKREPDIKTLLMLGDVLRCPLSRLLGRESRYEGGARIPILGTVKGGLNRMAEQEYEGFEVADVASPDEYFYLRVTGDSMAPQIQAGDLALIHAQDTLSSGEIGVVLLEDGEATIKRVLLGGTSVVLQPFNNAYVPIVLQEDNYRILGKVVRTTREW